MLLCHWLHLFYRVLHIVRPDLVYLFETLKLALNAVLKFGAKLSVKIIWLRVLEGAFECDHLSIYLTYIL
jgi:hypothetical protein